ncbi:unnamed protein product [Staurois parvus]|uniref:Secreted protein n=1 Tax=Staurois parvus TaxID=386267 RepID=A0ABN9HLB5_9NEOB|nr:unnamed protein product [Staurois parvus]
MTSVWTVLIGPVLITCTLPRKKKTLSSNTHQTEHVQLAPEPLFYQQIFRRHWKKGGSDNSGLNSIFTECRGLTP